MVKSARSERDGRELFNVEYHAFKRVLCRVRLPYSPSLMSGLCLYTYCRGIRGWMYRETGAVRIHDVGCTQKQWGVRRLARRSSVRENACVGGAIDRGLH